VAEESGGGGTEEGGDEEVTRGSDSRWSGAGKFVDDGLLILHALAWRNGGSRVKGKWYLGFKALAGIRN
jgi:hypothetical protein